MCTLIVLDRITPGYPLVVASNRDEFHSRPAAPPARVDPQENGHPPFVAPQDLEAGGTWMGVNAEGLFVGLTNRPADEPRRDRRSRGLLVRDALGRLDAQAAIGGLGEDLASVYNPFHLLAADGRRAFLTVVDAERAATRELSPGIHVVCNRDPEDPASRKVERLRGALQALDPAQPIERLFGGLAAVLGAHPDAANPLENPCVHTPEYGTRSSTVLALGERRWRCWHAEGAPCETKYSNLTRLLDELR
jgi:uncharacterized protein with NRDE domain